MLTPVAVTDRNPPCTAAQTVLAVRGRHLDDATLDELPEHRFVAGHDADLALGRLSHHEGGRTRPETALDGYQLDRNLGHVALLHLGC